MLRAVILWASLHSPCPSSDHLYAPVPRWEWAQTTFNSNRVFYAFVIDSALYSVWQVGEYGLAVGATCTELHDVHSAAGWARAACKLGHGMGAQKRHPSCADKRPMAAFPP